MGLTEIQLPVRQCLEEDLTPIVLWASTVPDRSATSENSRHGLGICDSRSFALTCS